jgi:hypothetical protein
MFIASLILKILIMKKITYIILLCLFTSITKSQPYGETTYPHTNSFLSSGTRVTLLGAGFLMAGYQINNAPATANFYIDRTGPGGGFPLGTPWFSNEYQIQSGSPGCIGGLNQVSNCSGVSVIEAQGGVGGLAYALTGAFDQGCFFATLDQNGSVIMQVFFEFPANSSRPTKPLIIQTAAQNTGLANFYLCGTYLNNLTRYTYIIKVNQTPTVVWSKIYDLGAFTSIDARAIVESPYTNDLAIVGSAYRSATAVGSKGFFMLVNNSTGALSSFEMIGQSTSLAQNDTLSSIAVANSPAPATAGFIVGGYLDTIPPGGATLVGKAWFMKLKPTGPVIWNSVFRTSLDPSAGMVMGVIERLSILGYQYYGAVFSPNVGIIVMRLDASGNPFTVTIPALANFNTFVYGGSGVLSSPNSISFEPNNLATNDLGIHVYGTYDVSSGGDHYFVEAYFNGAEPCLPTRNNLGTVSPGSNVFFYPTVSVNNGLSSCFNFNIAQSAVAITPSIICTATSMASGSNARQALATSLPEQNNASGLTEIFPNPSSERVIIKYSIIDEQPISFVLYDLLGNLIKQISPFPQTIGNHQVELNFKSLGLETGVYILYGNINGSDFKQKIIYRKE